MNSIYTWSTLCWSLPMIHTWQIFHDYKLISRRHRDAEWLILYCCVFCFFLSSFLSSFFRQLISEGTERISTKLGHIFTYDCYLKNLVRSPRAFTTHGLGENPLLGTDFELWPKISVQKNIITAIGNKLVKNLQGFPASNYGEQLFARWRI